MEADTVPALREALEESLRAQDLVRIRLQTAGTAIGVVTSEL